MRVFAKLREVLSAYKDLEQKIEKMEEKYDQRFQVVFETLDHMLVVESNPKKKIGFNVKEKIRKYGRKRQRCSY